MAMNRFHLPVLSGLCVPANEAQKGSRSGEEGGNRGEEWKKGVSSAP